MNTYDILTIMIITTFMTFQHSAFASASFIQKWKNGGIDL